MEINQSDRSGILIVEIKGSLDALTSRDAEQYLEALLERGKYEIVVDLKQVDFMSSAGLRMIMNISKETRQKGGDLRLSSPQPAVEKMLQVSGFTNFLRVFPDPESALESFRGQLS
jgi:anti-sigma B factor antagonist